MLDPDPDQMNTDPKHGKKHTLGMYITVCALLTIFRLVKFLLHGGVLQRFHFYLTIHTSMQIYHVIIYKHFFAGEGGGGRGQYGLE